MASSTSKFHGPACRCAPWSLRMRSSFLYTTGTYIIVSPITPSPTRFVRVCRPEVYRVKHLIYESVKMLSTHFSHLNMTEKRHMRRIYDILDEMFVADYHPQLLEATYPQSSEHIQCDCCAADIFQAYLECHKCSSSSEPYVICPMCYVEGRSCTCRVMTPCSVRDWQDLISVRNTAAQLLGEPICSPRFAG